jgi:hypothetical protein
MAGVLVRVDEVDTQREEVLRNENEKNRATSPSFSLESLSRACLGK